MGTTGRSAATRQHVVIAVAVLAVAALVLGVSAIRLFGSDSAHRPHAAQLADGPTSGTTDGTGTGSDVELDVGVAGQAAVADCVGSDFAADPADVTMMYGVQQRTHAGQTAVLVLRNAAGDLRLCDQYGADSPSQAPVETATADHPVTFLSNGRRDWNCTPDTHELRRFTITEWLSVAPQVDTVQLRFVVDGVAGPWFITHAHDGLVHLAGWLDGPQDRGSRVVMEHRVLDAAGDPVAQQALPGSQKLSGCAAGSAQIG